MKIRVLLFAIGAACLSGSCSLSGERLAVTGAPSDLAAPEAVQIAQALAEAENADRRGDVETLTRSVVMIRNLDAQPLDEAGKAQLAFWEAKLPEGLPPLRGRTLGAGYRSGVLAAGVDTKIEQTFLSGQKAAIAVSAVDGSKIGLHITNGEAQSVCNELAARPSCKWIPIFTQRHVIILSNPGRKKVKFYLVIE